MRNMKKRNLLSVLLIALILTVGVGSTVAYLIDQSDEVENTFEPTEVTCAVTETFANNVKSNVQIQNTGDVSAYMRAAIVVTWQDANGNVHAETPVLGTDYSMTINSDAWKLKDGFYYHLTAIDPNGKTPALITKCEVLAAAPATGYTLHVEIIAGAIQSEGGAVTVGSDGGWTITPVQ